MITEQEIKEAGSRLIESMVQIHKNSGGQNLDSLKKGGSYAKEAIDKGYHDGESDTLDNINYFNLHIMPLITKIKPLKHLNH